MPGPLVTVICLCYNQSQFVREAIDSVLNQQYKNIQLIIVDDASTDDSVSVIKKMVDIHGSIEFISLTENLGNCKAFNLGLLQAKGDFVIDFAADDILLPSRLEEGVRSLQDAGSDFGVHFSDADIIDEKGSHLYFHSDRFPHESIPQGNIYKDLISRYFICPTSMMYRREVIDQLKGYDESLAYEDFDFLIRSSRNFKFVYSPTVLVKKRITKNALAKKQFTIFTKHSQSTFIVCEKILKLNNSIEERKVLSKRIRYESLLNLRLLNLGIVVKYFFLWIRNIKGSNLG